MPIVPGFFTGFDEAIEKHKQKSNREKRPRPRGPLYRLLVIVERVGVVIFWIYGTSMILIVILSRMGLGDKCAFLEIPIRIALPLIENLKNFIKTNIDWLIETVSRIWPLLENLNNFLKPHIHVIIETVKKLWTK